MDCPDPKRSAVAGIPDDALVEILSRLPVKPLRRSKCVAKAWRDLIDDPFHRKKLPQTLEGFFHGGSDVACWPRRRRNYGYFTNLLGTSAAPLVDPSFPFLKELPNIENISLLGSCNGLLLFDYGCTFQKLGFIVCNPATKQWVAEPGNWTPAHPEYHTRHACLIFDPAVSSYFHVVQFCEKSVDRDIGGTGRKQIVAVDVEGNTRKIIPAPFLVGKNCLPVSDYVGQTQGRLHYIYHEECLDDDFPPELLYNVHATDFDHTKGRSYELYIWVLEDYDTQQWVLKLTVSFLELFGKTRCQRDSDYSVVAIHPDRNLVFLVQHWNQKLISYDMDSREVHDLCTLGHGYVNLTPYVPYFLELSALENKY